MFCFISLIFITYTWSRRVEYVVLDSRQHFNRVAEMIFLMLMTLTTFNEFDVLQYFICDKDLGGAEGVAGK